MTANAPQLHFRGELDIASPSDAYSLRADGTTLCLNGSSLRSFLRLRQQVSRLPVPDWAKAMVGELRSHAPIVLECRCRGRIIATVASRVDGIRYRPHPLQILRAALRL